MNTISIQLPTFATKAPPGAALLAELAVSLARAVARTGQRMVRSRQLVARDQLLDLAARYEASQPGMAADLRAAALRSVDPA